jgi:hypothetical protein
MRARSGTRMRTREGRIVSAVRAPGDGCARLVDGVPAARSELTDRS